MTKKKQSKRSAKPGAKKSSSRSGVAPTLHEIPAMKAAQAEAEVPQNGSTAKEVRAAEPAPAPAPAAAEPAPASAPAPAPAAAEPAPPPVKVEATIQPALPALDAHTLSAPEPIHPQPAPPDIAAEPTSHTSIASAVENMPHAEPSQATPPIPAPPVIDNTHPAPAPVANALWPSITNDIPMPATIPSGTPVQESAAQSQKTNYDIEALENAPPANDNIAAKPISSAPALNPQSLGSLTRSKSRSEIARGLSDSGKDDGYTWHPPVDYFGASASAFSSSFSGNSSRDLNALNKPGSTPSKSAQPAGPTMPGSAPASGSAPAPPPNAAATSPAASVAPAQTQSAQGLAQQEGTAPATPSQVTPSQATSGQAPGQSPLKVYESTTDAAALSPKMAKFVEKLRERELTASGASSPTLPQMEATSVEITPVPPQPVPTPVTGPIPTAPPTPAKITPINRGEAKPLDPKLIQSNLSEATSRDLTALSKPTLPENPISEAKPPAGDVPLAPKSSSQVAELRESIISQQAEDKPEDWHPVPQKKPRNTDKQFSADIDDIKKSDSKHKQDAERQLTLEEMAAMDPDLLLPQSQQQSSIQRLKSKAKGGIHAELYIPIYLICLGLGWVTEQSAAAGTFRDAGLRLESALELIAPKPLADNFMAGVNTYDDRDIKLHPFNPNKPRPILQLLFTRIQAFCSGLSAAFGRIPAMIAASSNANPLAEVMIMVSYLAVLCLSMMIYFKFKRSTSWIIADFILLPIGLVAASTFITPVFIAVLSMSSSLAANYLPNTIVAFTTIAIVICVFDMARRTFLKRKQAILRD